MLTYSEYTTVLACPWYIGKKSSFAETTKMQLSVKTIIRAEYKHVVAKNIFNIRAEYQQ